eukprot:scaffold60795_cov20-Cyclotella_meneghiniana.AAC.1
MEKVVKLSHRERVEELNEMLGSLTELNDIPRVSAAVLIAGAGDAAVRYAILFAGALGDPYGQPTPISGNYWKSMFPSFLNRLK